MCRPKKESGTGSLGGTSFVARALLFHNSTEIAARTSNAKRRKADLGVVDMLRVLLSNGGVSFGSLAPSEVSQGSGVAALCRSASGIRRIGLGGGGKAGFGASSRGVSG